MQAEVKRRIQTILIVAMLVAAHARAGFFYERSREADQAIEQEKERHAEDPLDADYYVTHGSFTPYDLAGHRLAKTPVWVRTGLRDVLLPV